MKRKALAYLMTSAMILGSVQLPAYAAETVIEETTEITETVENGEEDSGSADSDTARTAQDVADGLDLNPGESAEVTVTDTDKSKSETVTDEDGNKTTEETVTEETEVAVEVSADDDRMAEIEAALNLANMKPEWSYDADSSSWTLAPVVDVMYPEIEDEQGVSVNVPGAYVLGIDTDGDGAADVTEGTAVGNLVIDRSARVTSTNGQAYTAETAPVIVNTGAAGYSEQRNQNAASTYAAEGYINVACGNRGKQSSVTDADGNTVYTGDAPSCLVDQKNAVRFVKYNILLGNIPGNVNYFVSTGGSGGGAHATMLAATSDNADFFDYEADAGAVGCYRLADGTYVTSVIIDEQEISLSDGMWGCVAYSAITSLAEADMAMAFEYTQDPDYTFNTDFQKALAAALSEEYMDYINSRNLTIDETKLGYDLDGNGKADDTVALTIEYDAENGFSGAYLDLYLAEFEESFRSYLGRLDYAEDWTWFDENGTALSDDDVAKMSTEDKAEAFIHGRYTKSSSDRGGMGRMGGRGGMGGGMRGDGNIPDGDFPGEGGSGPDGGFPGGDGNLPDGERPVRPDQRAETNAAADSGTEAAADQDTDPVESPAAPNQKINAGAENRDSLPAAGDQKAVGTPDAGTTQAAGSKTDSASYESFDAALAAYQEDIAEVEAGDAYGKNIVDLYNPIRYIGAEGTNDPTWSRILCGAAEGDISMLNSLNLEIAYLAAGTDAVIEWQWDGGHVPNEIFGDSLALYVDQMYGKYVSGAKEIEKPAAEKQTKNGTAEEMSGTDISGWISYDGKIGEASFTLPDIAAYRTAAASKAVPGFDVIDYGQEDYVFGSSTKDARHWSRYVLNALEKHAEELGKLFNQSK